MNGFSGSKFSTTNQNLILVIYTTSYLTVAIGFRVFILDNIRKEDTFFMPLWRKCPALTRDVFLLCAQCPRDRFKDRPTLRNCLHQNSHMTSPITTVKSATRKNVVKVCRRGLNVGISYSIFVVSVLITLISFCNGVCAPLTTQVRHSECVCVCVCVCRHVSVHL